MKVDSCLHFHSEPNRSFEADKIFQRVFCQFQLINALYSLNWFQICRHGNRNPIRVFANDPCKSIEEHWVEGLGELTNVRTQTQTWQFKIASNFYLLFSVLFLDRKTTTLWTRPIYAKTLRKTSWKWRLFVE